MNELVLVVPPNTFGAEPNMLGDRLGIDYLLAVLRRAGLTASMVHAPAKGLNTEQIVEAIVSHAPRVVGITAPSSWRDLETLGQITGGVRANLPHAHITLGGYSATFGAREMLASFPEVDSIVQGEGEETLLELVERLFYGNHWEDTMGLVSRREGLIKQNAPRALIRDLDRLPFPARDFLTLGVASLDSPVLLSSSRGCYGTCSFCSVNRFYRMSPGSVWRARSPASTAGEIEDLKQQWGVRRFQFIDDNFVGPGRNGRDRAVKLAKEFIHRKLGIEFFVQARADTIEEELFRLLMHAGLAAVFVGIESGVQRTLDLYRKKTKVETNLRAIEVLDRIGLHYAPGLITFEPFVTPEDLQANVRFLRTSGLADQQDIFTYFGSFLIVYAGTELEQLLDSRGLLSAPVKSRVRQCINIKDYRFADPRSEMLFQIMTTWRSEMKRRYTLPVLGNHPELKLETAPGEKGPRSIFPVSDEDRKRAWLQAQNHLLLDLFEQAIHILLETNDLNEHVINELEQSGLSALQELDVRFWGVSLGQLPKTPGYASRSETCD